MSATSDAMSGGQGRGGAASAAPGGAPVRWPELPYAAWADTKKTLQLYTQIAGKIRLALSPAKPEWLHAALMPTSRGLTTGPMPSPTGSVEMEFDFFRHRISLSASDGRVHHIPLTPARCVANIFADVIVGFAGLGVGTLQQDIWTKPQEVGDTTPLDEDVRHCTYEPADVERWFSIVTAIRNIFDEWRSLFFGRTELAFWWGAFDLGVLRFNGRRAEPRSGSNYIMRYDLDAEFMNAGFWPGDDTSPAPVFYAYIYPQPPGCELAPVAPESAAWIEQMGEWAMPYDWLRACPDQRQAILDFLDSVYAAAGEYGGWDLPSYEYVAPPKRHRG